MPSKVYSVSELLALRGSQSSDQLSDRVKTDTEIGCIFRRQDNIKVARVRREAQSSEDTAAESDRSTVVRHPPTKKSEGQWKYRGRSKSELNSSRPILAPTTISAQKDEGFQRFYKAVVSPTHVRVTAGGRIVPNNRGPASPTTKYPKERPGLKDHNADHPNLPPQTPAEPVQFVLGPSPHPPVAFVYPAQYSGMMQNPSAMPFLPLPLAFNMSGSGYPSAAPAQVSHVTSVPAYHAIQKAGQADASLEKPSKARAPPVENFDPSRPLVYPGQWLMSTNPPIYPFGLLPPPGYPPVQISGPGLHQSHPMDVMQSQTPVIRTGCEASQVASTTPRAIKATSNADLKPLPPISSIRPSDITKKQMTTLRSNLKFIEDQLQYNKHQIDERSMEYQAQIVRTHIQHFEKILDLQLADEEPFYHSMDHPTDISAASVSHTSQRSTETCSVGDSKSDKGTSKDGQTPRPRVDPPATRRVKSIFTGISLDSHPKGIITPARFNCLPMSAALAQPFEPSSELMHTLPYVDGASSYYANGTAYQQFGLQPPGHADVHHFKEACNSHSASGSSRPNEQVKKGENDIRLKNCDLAYSHGLSDNDMRARQLYWGMGSHIPEDSSHHDNNESQPSSPSKEKVKKLNATRILVEGGQYLQKDGKPKLFPVEQILQKWPNSRPSQSDHSGNHDVENEDPGKDTGKKSQTVKYYVPMQYSKKGISVSEDTEMKPKPLRLVNRSSDRASGKTCNELWNSMVKKTPKSSAALPGTVTSATAHGYLPQYGGHAAASLTPAIANPLPHSS